MKAKKPHGLICARDLTNGYMKIYYQDKVDFYIKKKGEFDIGQIYSASIKARALKFRTLVPESLLWYRLNRKFALGRNTASNDL